MCEFCLQHGEGKKWYLNAKNYSEDLLSDAWRRDLISEFFRHPEGMAEAKSRMENQLHKAPAKLRQVISRRTTKRQKKEHFGQVLPIEDVEEIFGFVNSIIRVPCICRHALLGKEARYCYGITLGPNDELNTILNQLDDSFLTGPDNSPFEELTKDEALEAFREHEREGMCHSVWTFGTPFIGGICNCDRVDCMAMQSTVVHDMKVMFRAEYIAEVDPDECNGCRSCMRVCQFGALAYSPTNEKAYVDIHACYGCGSCRSVCSKDAISLKDRAEVEAVAEVW